MILLIVRGTTLEGFRDPFEVSPNVQLYPSAAGVGSALVLDALCCVPALLVSLCQAIDPSLSRRGRISHWIGGALGAWVWLSSAWADDKFAAICFAAHFTSAIALFWTMSQVVRGWRDLRWVGGFVFALLLVNIGQGLIYRYIELPDTLRDFQQHKSEFLSQRGWKANDFYATQFEQKLVNGELFGFTTSSNSYGAVLVLLAGACAGLVIQRIADDGEKAIAWAALICLALPAVLFLLACTQSKAVAASPVLLLGVVLLMWRGGGWARKSPRRAMVAVCSCFVAMIAGVVGYGLLRHRLPTDSLKFRWWYWSAAWRMFLDRPWLGVGWANFGQHYLHFRLPIASEEIKDPHNFLLKFLTETGLPGLCLVAAWTGRCVWELLHRGEDPNRTREVSPGGFSLLTATTIIVALGTVGSCAANIDFSQPFGGISLDLLKRLLFGCIMIAGPALILLKRLQPPTIDARPAPWLAVTMTAAVAVFLVHNLIEFSLFDNGPLIAVGAIGGAVLGVYGQDGNRPPRWRNGLKLTVAFLLWLGGLAGVVIPIVHAEAAAQAADVRLQKGQFREASVAYAQAFSEVPANADYAYRAGRALLFGGEGELAGARSWFDRAIEHNPSDVRYYLRRAQLEALAGDVPGRDRDFKTATELNPNEVSLRLNYAQALAGNRDFEAAGKQLEIALDYNEQFPIEERKRLNDYAICAPLGQMMLEQGRAREAARYYQRALDDNAKFSSTDFRVMTDDQVATIKRMLEGIKARSTQPALKVR